MAASNIIITGGHSGIGLALTRRLVSEGHRVGVIARSEDRLKALRKSIAPSEIDFFQADLASQSEIANAAEKIARDWDRIDVLFNNAGVLLEDLSWSPQNNEIHYEVNTLAPLALMHALKPMLDRAAEPQVINTSTDPVVNAKAVDFEVLQKPEKIVKLFGSYVVSKTAMTAAMAFVAGTPAYADIVITSVAPGAIKTSMTSGPGMPRWMIPLRNLFFSSPEKGADRLYDAAFHKGDPRPSGTFLAGNKVKPMKIRLDRQEFEKIISGLKENGTFLSDLFDKVEASQT